MTTPVCPLPAYNASSSNNHNNNSNSNNNTKTANTRKTNTTTTTAKPLPPPRSSRRRPQNINTLLMLVVLMCQLQQFVRSGGGDTAGGFGGGCGFAMAAPTSTPHRAATDNPKIPLRDISANRKRLQKRQSDTFNERFHRELNSTVLDWSNGCGGNWTGEETSMVRPHKRCEQHKKLLRTLQNKTGREQRHLRNENKRRKTVNSIMAPDTSSNQAIDISQRNTWKGQNNEYSFLPRLNTSAQKLQLRRVHQDLQFYVAAFSYLRHTQLHWDYENLQKQSVLSAELQRYRNSSRIVLCLVEEAINATQRLYAPSRKLQQQRQRIGHRLQLGRIKTLSRSAMEERLKKFKTPLVQQHKQAVLAALNQPVVKAQEPHLLDTLFVKDQYMRYLKQMTQVLAKQRKTNCADSKSNPKQKAQRTQLRARQRQVA